MDETISFSDVDAEGIQTSHDDAIVVFLTTVNFDVKWISVDNESSVDILFVSLLQHVLTDWSAEEDRLFSNQVLRRSSSDERRHHPSNYYRANTEVGHSNARLFGRQGSLGLQRYLGTTRLEHLACCSLHLSSIDEVANQN